MVGSPKPLWIVANFKSHETIQESIEWISTVGPHVEDRPEVQIIVCPTFTSLAEVKHAAMVGNYRLQIGSQDISPFEEGAYTGEEAAPLLKELANYAIIGHSERRTNFQETDEMVAKKVAMATEAGITPIVCVQGAETPVPDGCTVVAYEPVFAIGTGTPDTPQNANEVATKLKEKYGQDLNVLYGGSVTEENIKAFLEQDLINGSLIGGASLDPEQFLRILEVVYKQNRG